MTLLVPMYKPILKIKIIIPAKIWQKCTICFRFLNIIDYYVVFRNPNNKMLSYHTWPNTLEARRALTGLTEK